MDARNCKSECIYALPRKHRIKARRKDHYAHPHASSRIAKVPCIELRWRHESERLGSEAQARRLVAQLSCECLVARATSTLLKLAPVWPRSFLGELAPLMLLRQ